MTTAFRTANANPQQPRLLRVCRIGRAQGLKGEVNVLAFTDEPEKRFRAGSQLVTAAGRAFTIKRSRRFKQRWILTLAGINDRTAAEQLNGTELFIALPQREEPTDDEATESDRRADAFDDTAFDNTAFDNTEDTDDGIYYDDLIGLSAQLEDGTALGTITDAIDSPAQTLLELTEPHGSVSLVPFVEAIVPAIDLDAGTITLDPPGGLLQEH